MAGQKKRSNSQHRLASFFGAIPTSGGKQGSSVGQGETEEISEGAKPVAAHVFSGRFLISALVVFMMVVAVYAPLTTFFKQQAEINQVKANIASLQSENENLKTQLSWWHDDNYVKQQAKSRLYFVTEGETPYLVVGTDYTSELVDDTSAASQTAPQRSWTNNLWDSFQESALEEQESK